MKQLNEFKNWADSIVNEFDGSRVKKEKAPIAGDRDIARQAQSKYGGYDKEQSLELFIADKLEDMEKRDLEQNKVINTQRRANDALRKELTTMSQEVHDIADQEQSDQLEIDRLRSLATGAKQDKETNTASRQEVADLLSQVDALSKKPGVSDEDYEKLKKEVETNAKKGADPQAVEQLKSTISDLQSQDEINKDTISDLNDMAAQLAANQQSTSKSLSGLDSEIKSKVAAATKTIDSEVKKVDSEVKKVDRRLNTTGTKLTNAQSKATTLIDRTKDKLKTVTKSVKDVETNIDDEGKINLKQQSQIDSLLRSLNKSSVSSGGPKIQMPGQNEKIINQWSDDAIDSLYSDQAYVNNFISTAKDKKKDFTLQKMVKSLVNRGKKAPSVEALYHYGEELEKFVVNLLGHADRSVDSKHRYETQIRREIDALDSYIEANQVMNPMFENILGPEYSKYLK